MYHKYILITSILFILQGLPSIARVVIDNYDDSDGKTKYRLFVEGDNFRDVMATMGVLSKKTTSNNTLEVSQKRPYKSRAKCAFINLCH